MTVEFVEEVSGAVADVVRAIRDTFPDNATVVQATRSFLGPGGATSTKARISAIEDKGTITAETDLAAYFRVERADRKRFSSDNPDRDSAIAVTTDNRVAARYGATFLDAVYRSMRAVLNDRAITSDRIFKFAEGEFDRLDAKVAASDGTTLAIYEGMAGFMAMIAVEACASKTFTTADDVQSARETMIRQYEAITGYGISLDTAEEAATAIHEGLEYLETLDLQLPRLQDIEISEFPSSVLAYQLYGSTERQDALLDLNPNQSPVLFERRVTVLQDAR